MLKVAQGPKRVSRFEIKPIFVPSTFSCLHRKKFSKIFLTGDRRGHREPIPVSYLSTTGNTIEFNMVIFFDRRLSFAERFWLPRSRLTMTPAKNSGVMNLRKRLSRPSHCAANKNPA